MKEEKKIANGLDINDPLVIQSIHGLLEKCGGDPSSFNGDLTIQMIQTILKLMRDKHDSGQMKLITRALKEMRYAYKVFNQYPSTHRISIFGSARTPETHPDYLAAKAFSINMAKLGWMCITGAADGIMKAGLEGAEKASIFGLSIRLPFEIPTNIFIEGDPKLMMFHYFFTRKLMFLSHSDAVAVFPGGFGTLDELFEVLTLMHNGKCSIIPTVLVEGTDGIYWAHWKQYIETHLLANGWISPADVHLYYFASSPEDAQQHIQQFYKRYHSSRYVKDILVLRLLSPLTEEQIEILNEKFPQLIRTGKITTSSALPPETDHLELPRLIFHHTRKDFGLLRVMIDTINSF